MRTSARVKAAFRRVKVEGWICSTKPSGTIVPPPFMFNGYMDEGGNGLFLPLLEIQDSLPLAKTYLIVPVPAICGAGGRVTRGGHGAAPPPFLREVLTLPPFVKTGRRDFISIRHRKNARQLKALPSSVACIPCSMPVKELKLLAPPPRKSLLYLCFPLLNLLCFIFFITFLWTIYKCFLEHAPALLSLSSRKHL